MGEGPSAAVLVPVKAFALAKARLAPALPALERAALARSMAERVVLAAAPMAVFVACEDREVAEWAMSRGAQVVWSPDTGLNGAVQLGFGHVRAAGYEIVIVAHADLPNAQRLDRVAGFDGVTLVPDRADDGTNVLALPASASSFTFSYGPGSFTRHLTETERIGQPARVLRLPDLQWDVDTPDDLPQTAAT